MNAWPITSCGLRLDDEAIRVAVGLRLGSNLCMPHECPCGALVDARGSHGLSCRRSAGRLPRHSMLNDLVRRALVRAGVPATLEPLGLLRNDGKRPDGCTGVPWSAGKCLTWDVTVSDTLAASHLPHTSIMAGAAAERAKEEKYQDITRTHDFVAIALETLGPICEGGSAFLDELGRLLVLKTGDPREKAFLYQRLSIAIQRCNALSFAGSFTVETFSR